MCMLCQHAVRATSFARPACGCKALQVPRPLGVAMLIRVMYARLSSAYTPYPTRGEAPNIRPPARRQRTHVQQRSHAGAEGSGHLAWTCSLKKEKTTFKEKTTPKKTAMGNTARRSRIE